MKKGFIVIGDIYGCCEQLDELLGKLEKYTDREYVFLGNYIDRGPRSDDVVERVRKLGGVALMGNREWELARNLSGGASAEGPAYKPPQLSKENLDWLLKGLPLLHSTDQYIFVHAGLDPLDPAGRKPEELLWSRYAGEYPKAMPKLIIHGHVKVDALEKVGNRVNINTGCSLGGPLSALVLPEMELVQSKPSPVCSQSNLDKARAELQSMFGVEGELETL